MKQETKKIIAREVIVFFIVLSLIGITLISFSINNQIVKTNVQKIKAMIYSIEQEIMMKTDTSKFETLLNILQDSKEFKEYALDPTNWEKVTEDSTILNKLYYKIENSEEFKGVFNSYKDFAECFTFEKESQISISRLSLLAKKQELINSIPIIEKKVINKKENIKYCKIVLFSIIIFAYPIRMSIISIKWAMNVLIK